MLNSDAAFEYRKNYSNQSLANSFDLFKTLLFIFEESGGTIAPQPPCSAEPAEGRESLGSVTGSHICDDNGQSEYENLENFVPQSEEEDTAEENTQSSVESAPQRRQKKKQGRKSVCPNGYSL